MWVPLAGGVALFVLLAYSFKVYWDPNQSYFTITVFGITIGGTLVVVVLATIAGLLWMLWSMRTQPEYFSGESMRLGLSITDDDQVVRVDMDGIEHGGLGHGAQPPDPGAGRPPDSQAGPPQDPGGWR